MALRRRGKDNFYHAYFRKVVSQVDGSLKYTTTTINLGTDNLKIAQALEADLMKKNRIASRHQRMKAHMLKLEIESGIRPVDDLPESITYSKRKRRLQLSDGIEATKKYRELG